jgi:uncharacterized protein YbbK (DUF523 family)
MYLVSACLAGVDCNYKGGNWENEHVMKLVEEGKAVLCCPEAAGGLPTPRTPAEIIDGKVITKDGDDVTDAFLKGAGIALELCKEHNCTKAILKATSPSCGKGTIYDGNFNGTIIEGDGITTKLLQENGIEVISSDEINKEEI